MDKRESVEKQLFYWNVSMCLFHGLQGVAALVLSLTVDRLKNFKLPLNTVYTKWEGGFPAPVLETQALLPFVLTTSLFSWLSALFHLFVLLGWKKYVQDLRKGINQFRWYEYSLSSSLMIVLISMLFGVYDIFTLVNIFAVNACMNLFGLMMELLNYEKKKNDMLQQSTTSWISFVFGCFAGVVPWITIVVYIVYSGDASLIPKFVWAILAADVFLFAMFPINMLLQYMKIGPFKDKDFEHSGYYFGEKVYQVLSLVAKTLLVWLVVGGVNQPNQFVDLV